MVSDSDISQDLWDDIKSALVAAVPVITSSLATTDTTVASITSTYNDKAPTRPQIVIHPILVDEGDWKFGSVDGKKLINVVVDCYASKTLYVDQLWDQVRNTLVQNTIAGVDLNALTSDYGFSDPGDQKFHVKTATFTYLRE